MIPALAFARDTVLGLDEIAKSTTPVTTIKVPTITGIRTVHFATSIEAFEEVLLRRDYKTVKTGPYYEYLVANYGPWLLSTNAEQHKSYTPHKHFSNADDFANYLQVFFPFAERRVAAWPIAARGEVDSTELFHSVTFAAILGLCFNSEIGFGPGDKESAPERARRELMTKVWHFTRRDMELFGRTSIPLKWLYASKYKHYRELCFREWDGLLARLGPDEVRYAAKMRAAGFISDDFIRTTMTAVLMFIPFFLVRILQFSLMKLAAHPAIETTLRADIAKLGAEDMLPKFSERAPYLDAFVKEVLRLFPVFYILDRITTEDQELAGTRMRKGEQIFLSPYLLHRDARLWPDPLKFDPGRFSGPKPKGYYPFGLGPHMCAGQAFAPAILKTMLVQVLRQYRFTPIDTPRISGGIPGLRFASEPRFSAERVATA